jgi:hypothetical protein
MSFQLPLINNDVQDLQASFMFLIDLIHIEMDLRYILVSGIELKGGKLIFLYALLCLATLVDLGTSPFFQRLRCSHPEEMGLL